MRRRAGFVARSRERGASTIEMTLVGIPLIFVLISIFEISRGMWVYHTMAFSVREATRYAMVHGENCVPAPPTVTNNCAITVGNVAQKIIDHGAALVCSGGNYSCVNVAFDPPPATACGNLQTCLTNTSIWPPDGANGIGVQIRITITTPFNSALTMLWPGAGSVQFGQTNFSAQASERIQF